jgi:hypothetical protein
MITTSSQLAQAATPVTFAKRNINSVAHKINKLPDRAQIPSLLNDTISTQGILAGDHPT